MPKPVDSPVEVGAPLPKRVSLVLSSGGARGLAHIGVIRALEAAGFEIVSVSGASMGALVGGVYATGKLDDYTDWVSAMNRSDIVRLLDFGWGAGGLIRGERVMGAMRELIGEWSIEELPIEFTAVATDLSRKREVWLTQGSLFDAIRASIAIPMVFAPVNRSGQLLIDGGVLNPLPIAPVLGHAGDLIVAVDVNGEEARVLTSPSSPDTHADVDDSPPSEDRDGLGQTIAGFVEDLFADDGEPEPAEPGMFNVALDAMDAMQGTISRLKRSAYQPDLLIEVPRETAKFFEFERASELIGLGQQLTEDALNPPC